ncbi:MAG: hypothetical protein F6J90_12425 [Moorea sp. SIOASIH]|nr:hypothetical protein [Moorena sp. SIOASIH]
MGWASCLPEGGYRQDACSTKMLGRIQARCLFHQDAGQDTGKMPVPPRCRAGYRQDACSTKMPLGMKQARCLFHQDAGQDTGKMPVPTRCWAGYRQDACSTKMPVPPRCLFHQDACSTKMPGRIQARCLFH